MTNKAGFWSTFAVIATLPFASAAQDFSAADSVTNFVTEHPTCSGVAVANITFCPEECGQDQSQLSLRTTYLETATNMADDNNDGQVFAGFQSYSLETESNPGLFGSGRVSFMQRIANGGDTQVIEGTSQNFTIDGNQPYGRAFFSDSRKGIACAMQ